jgi:hypothetical protein
MAEETKPRVAVGVPLGRLIVVAEEPRNKHGQRVWRCRCRCGGETVATHSNLATGGVRSCGCLRRDADLRRHTKHGHAQVGRVSREYSIWLGIKDRCLNPDSRNWPRYGGRGIKVCDEWQDSFEAFLRDMGHRPAPGFSVDRKENDGPYAPWNCRWATRREQTENRRNAVMVPYQGKMMWLPDAAEASGLPYGTLRSRLRLGWPPERLFDPADRHRTDTVRPKTGRPPERTVVYQGERVPLVEAARRAGLDRWVVARRIAAGWPEAELFGPSDRGRRRVC